MLNPKIALSVLSLALSSFLATDCRAALVFTVNSLANVNLSFSDAFPSTQLTISVREDEFNSGGVLLDRFAFRLVLNDSSVATISQVVLSSPGNLTSQIATTAGASSDAAGVFSAKPNHFAAAVDLATFTITGLKTGSTGVRILERTVGDDDFRNLAAGVPVDRDLTVFTVGNPPDLRGAVNQINVSGTLTAIPEPSSMSFVLLGGLIAFRRRVR